MPIIVQDSQGELAAYSAPELGIRHCYLLVLPSSHDVTTYDDLSKDGQYNILVRVRSCSRSTVENRAFELNVEDTEGTRFPFIVWEKSARGRNYDWRIGCWYRLSGASVNEWPSGKVLHGASALEIETVGTRRKHERVNILYLTDSHLGKTSHSYRGNSWSVSPEKGFRAAIEQAVEQNVDAVVHGGDLFHNDGDGIDEREVALCRESLIELAEYGIPFYFIYGNHERHAGRRKMEQFVDDGLAVHLGPRYEIIGDTLALYGIDYQSEWAELVIDLEPSSPETTTILCVHQSIGPFSEKSNPDASLNELGESANVPLNLILVGHTHTRSERLVGQCKGVAGGATTRVGQNEVDLLPSAELISVEDDDMTVERVLL